MNQQGKTKKVSIGFYISIVSAILAVVALIFCILNEKEKNDISMIVLAPTMAAILVEIIVVILTKVVGYKEWFANANILNTILVAFAFIMYVTSRTSYIQGLTVALEVFSPTFLGTMICFAATFILSIASSFIKQAE